MTLTLYDFNDLDEKAKGEVVFQDGTFIDNREEEGLKIQLYRLAGFYVEVFYDGKANQILQYRAFSSVSQLSPYLKNS
jgi:abortive infection bacteriophage resistance protein